MIIYLKRLKSSKFVRVKAFPMYGGMGVSAPSLHRESTDSLTTDSLIGYLSSVVIGHFPTLIEERRAVICMHFHQHKALKGSICIPNSSDRPLISKSINNHMTVLQHYTHHNRSHDTLQGI